MTSREQFEAWCINRLISVTRMVGCDSYKSWRTRELWAAWKVSRSKFEINLPVKNDISDEDHQIPDLSDWDDGRNSGIQECVESIRAAGIKVKDC